MKHRPQLLDAAILGTLKACGGYLLPEDQLAAEVFLRVAAPPLLRSEHDERVRDLEARGLILGLRGDYGVKWKLTDAGRAFCAEHRL